MLNTRRRRTLSLVLTGLVTFALAACGEDPSDASDASDPAAAGATTGETDASATSARSPDTSAATPELTPGAATPATTAEKPAAREITHALGTTEVPADPQRIVALGPAELDAALALGAPVVGTASNGTDAGIAPWTAELEGAEGVQAFSVEGDALAVDLEQVAAADPDLILAPTYYDIDNSYDKLSQIAPTVAYQDGPVTDTWQQVTRQVGAALGREAEADALVTDVEQTLSDAAAAHPDLDGATYTFGYVQPDNVSVLRDPGDAMMLVPKALGLTMSPSVLDLPRGDSFAATVSLEQLDVLEADVLALFDGGDRSLRKTFESNPLYQQLDVVARDAVDTYSYDEFIAMRQPTAASIPWSVDRLVPRLAAAAATASGTLMAR